MFNVYAPITTTERGEIKYLIKRTINHPEAYGYFAPRLTELTDDVLFANVWERTELSRRDRSLVTVAALIANGNTIKKAHLNRSHHALFIS